MIWESIFPLRYFLEEACVDGLSRGSLALGNNVQPQNKGGFVDDTIDAAKAMNLLATIDHLSDEDVDSLLDNLMGE